MRKLFYLLIVFVILGLLIYNFHKPKNEDEFYFSGGRTYQGGDIRTSTCYVVVNRNYYDETLIDRILELYILMNGKPTYLTFELYYKKTSEKPYATYQFDFSGSTP